ncbi:glycosyltransferase family protein [Enterococcus gallinarum]|uniref:hypothetical protein n=1 Tax=Enterococcus gallinarum TaxID=1353 RepID=UPI001476012C|nr:hypothetical protein [Enterococcus gallinarum]MDV7823340.1 hypothetical protein [Enterococcus gallinarum]MDV7872578.1 hypothetical protein [Enterococcus gallinarum]NME48365.1 glycosyltransferase family 4 protein [Enterococcus gallinarum]
MIEMKILFIVRKYFPDISASGNLIKPLAEAMTSNSTIDVLCLGESNKRETINEIDVIRIRAKKKKQLRIINKINRNLGINYYDNSVYMSILEVLNSSLKNSYDKFIAITYEEALALRDSDIDQEKKCMFLLEKIPYVNEFKKRFFKKKIIDNQTNFFNSFSKIFCLNDVVEELASYIPQDIINKIVSLRHPMIREYNTNLVKDDNNEDNKTIRFLYGGGLDRKQRNPEKVIQLMSGIASRENILFTIFSYGNYQERLKELEKSNFFLQVYPPIDSEQFKSEMIKSDFLISIGNKESDIIPSKIFDYISSQRPIVHFAQSKDDKYFKILKEYPYALILNLYKLDKSESELLTFIEKYKAKKIPSEFIKNTFKQYTPEYVGEKIFIGLLEGKLDE